MVSLLIKAPVVEMVKEVITLPLASATQLNKIVKQRSTGGGISRVYICVQNSTESYEWIQIGIST
ncbi:unnamed protein product [marine sediment metagenome]|uniref:Uncharacterized protein n=1 Tax=marine sediment metagenome TaxID=412755 RepID=X1UIS2_9ZZZZ